jgi:hypothetical protein
VSATDYTVLNADSTESIGEAVVRYIQEGWEPLGGVAVVVLIKPTGRMIDTTVQTLLFFQAMVRREEE